MNWLDQTSDRLRELTNADKRQIPLECNAVTGYGEELA